MTRPVAVYVVRTADPSIGALPGDRLIVEPAHPTMPFTLQRDLAIESMAEVLSHAELEGTSKPSKPRRSSRRVARRGPRSDAKLMLVT